MDRISVIGLGYAGLHTAIAFGKKKKVIGFDIDTTRVNELLAHKDRHHEFSSEELEQGDILYTDDETQLQLANFHIIVVPTPINLSREPDLTALQGASTLLAKQLKKNDIVVYESTVYPGVTEEVCIPILEAISQLKCGIDFHVGYSPERINPGDKIHNFYNTIKIVSSTHKKSLAIIKEKYQSVIQAKVFCVSSVKIAEAVKIIENAQRDVNIAFANEFAQILHLLGLDTQEVIAAAKTKWNFLDFKPGLVGGHCIAVDPYYLIQRSEELGYYPDLLISARRINNRMGSYIARALIKRMIQEGINITDANVAILGITYKENVSDIRNTLVIETVRELVAHQIQVKVHDPLANKDEVAKTYNIQLCEWSEIQNVSAMIVAVAHDQFKYLTKDQYLEKFDKKGILMDIKGIINAREFLDSAIKLWRL